MNSGGIVLDKSIPENKNDISDYSGRKKRKTKNSEITFLSLNQIHKTSGRVIRKYRNMAYLSIEDLAEQMGVSNAFVGLIEQGQRGLRLDKLLQLKQLLKIPYEELFEGKEISEDDHKKPGSYDLIINALNACDEQSQQVIVAFINNVAMFSETDAGDSVLQMLDTIMKFIYNTQLLIAKQEDTIDLLRIQLNPEKENINKPIARTDELKNSMKSKEDREDPFCEKEDITDGIELTADISELGMPVGITRRLRECGYYLIEDLCKAPLIEMQIQTGLDERSMNLLQAYMKAAGIPLIKE